jgi:hypothetical protein
VERHRRREQQVEVDRDLEDPRGGFGQHQRAVPHDGADDQLEVSKRDGDDGEAEEFGRCLGCGCAEGRFIGWPRFSKPAT